MRRLLARIVVATLLGASLAFPVQAQTDSSGFESPLGRLLADARRLLAGGEPKAAYALLESRSALYAGSVDFDTLLGYAALDSGNPGSAVIAFERVLAAEPANLPVRAEIGRAYLQLKEVESARRELESVASRDLPPEVRRTIGRYLDTVARLERLGRPQWLFTIEAQVGWDDNVNFGSALGEWILADGQSLLPLPVSRPRSSGFAALAAGAQYIVPIGGQVEWTAGFLGSQRTNPSQHNMDMGSLELSSGLSYSTGAHRYSMSLQYQHLRLDDAAFRNATGVIGQWQYDVGRRSQVGAYLQWFDLAFPDQPFRDARRVSAGGTFAHGFLGAGRPVVAASLQAGAENTRDDLPQLSFGFAGVRTAVGATLGRGWRASGGWSFERRDFDGSEPLFGAVREDRQHDYRLALERDLNRNLTLSPTLLHTRNRSTIAPNDFRRTQVYLYARYRF